MIYPQRAILAAALGCCASTAALAATQAPGAERWIAANATGASFVDTQSVIRKDSYAVIWRMQNLQSPAAPISNAGGAQARSVKYEVEYDCAAHRERALSSESYSGSMGAGRLVGLSYAQQAWRPAPVGGHGFQLACGSLPQPAIVASAP